MTLCFVLLIRRCSFSIYHKVRCVRIGCEYPVFMRFKILPPDCLIFFCDLIITQTLCT